MSTANKKTEMKELDLGTMEQITGGREKISNFFTRCSSCNNLVAGNLLDKNGLCPKCRKKNKA